MSGDVSRWAMKPIGRHLLVGVAGERGHEIAVIIERDVFESHRAELLLQMLGEYHLARCRRGHISEFVTLSVKLDVLQKSVCYGHDMRFT